MTNDCAALIRTADEISDRWLGEVLGSTDLALISTTRIGTGQMSHSHRVCFQGPLGSGSVVVKTASDDANSRATGVGMGAYYREVAFYANASNFQGPLPSCHLAVYDEAEGWFTLVLEDIAEATQGDQIRGCSQHDARLAIQALAQMQAPVFDDPAVGARDYLNLPNPLDQKLLSALLPIFLDRYGDDVTEEHAEVCRTFVAVLDAWAADRRPPMGLMHGDFRLDNLLFTADSCTVVDWQTVSWGPAMRDVAYFLGSGLTVEDRRTFERDLLRYYFDELVRGGVRNFTWEQCWEEYRRQSFACLVLIIAAGVAVERTDRGDAMFMTVLARACQQILDLDAVDLLPALGAPTAALRPEPCDEGRHEPGLESQWNESWYFDAVDESGSVGVYVRLGLVPNGGHCFYAASIVRPGQPAAMVLDEAAPLPVVDGPTERVLTASLRASQECLEPLARFHVKLDATAQAYEDHSAPLRGEPGVAVQVSLDLTWETDGIPYAWRAATRYEIPCRVTGHIRIDGQQYALTGPGQRDHSWGSRDWWATDWMWSAFHLEDGTRTHAVMVPDMPGGLAVGYAQRGDSLVEVQTGSCTETVGSDGLITMARVITSPDDLTLDVEPLAFGALRLVAPDGRITHFPRAMAKVRTTDGRAGIGWIEWNRNQC